MNEPIAIIGIGCMFPKANGLTAFWSNIREGVDAVSDVPPTHWRPEDYYNPDPSTPDHTYGRRGAFLDPVDFDPLEFGIAPRDIEATDTSQLFGLAVAKQALEDAGYGAGGKSFDRERVSVILGVTGALELVIPLGARLGHPIWRRALEEAGVAAEVAEDVVGRIAEGYVGWQENSFPGLLGNVVAGRIANRLDLQGTNCVVDAACASSLSAVHLAALELQSGRAEMAIAGGVDTFNDIFMHMCFSKTPALSPTGDARPFDQASDGTILGEGLGMMVFKRLSAAERDGDQIYAVLRGVGSSSDGKGNAVYAPSAEGQARALRAAYRDADVSPATVELVETHGTGTKVGDATELEGLGSVYREASEAARWCAIGSVKSMIGHTKAAAGAAGMIKAILALRHRVLPPTIKVQRPAKGLEGGATPFYVNRWKRPWIGRDEHPRRAAVSAFGFGGSNFHCVLEEHAGTRPAIDWDGKVQILAFSAQTREELAAKLREAPDASARWEAWRAVAAKSRLEFRPEHACRLLIVAEAGGRSPAELLADAGALLEGGADARAWARLKGVSWGEGAAAGKLAALFPGQGAQSVGMLRDLACQFPAMQEALAGANAAFGERADRLSDLVYPVPAFDEETRAAQEAALTATEVAQPALGAISLGLLRVLEHFGVKLDAAAGHSYGELVALCSAGVLREADFHRLSSLRGRLMSAGAGDRGAMLAVFADGPTVEEFLRRHALRLAIANRNGPRQNVLSGSTPEIERAAGLLGSAGLKGQRLQVAAAFHSPLVAAAAEPFGQAVAEVAWEAARFPVYANTNAQPYPELPEAARGLLARQLAEPVDFVGLVRNLYAAGVRSFVEIGPGRRLTGLASEILAERQDALTVAVDASSGKNHGTLDLALALARLAARGHSIELTRWDEGALDAFERSQKRRKPLLTVSLSGANYVAPKPKRPPRPASVTPAPSAAMQQPVPRPEPVGAAPPLAEAIRATESSLNALVRLQEQTAELHRLFLEGQMQATQSFQALLERQQTLFASSSGIRYPEREPVSRLVEQPAARPQAASPGAGGEKPMAGLAHGGQGRSASGGSPLGSGQGLRGEEAAPLPERAPPAPGKGLAPSALPGSGSVERRRVVEALLSAVSEKTGYPAEMLELTMGLDGDLGIDSIKRVEILSALQERLPEAPVVKPEHLGRLQTLGQIADFLAQAPDTHGVQGRSPWRGEGAAPLPERALPAPGKGQGPSASHGAAKLLPGSGSVERRRVVEALLSAVSEKTGYPAEMLELTMGLDGDLGIDSIKRVEILSALQERLPEAPVVKPEHLGRLQTLGQIADFLAQAPDTHGVQGRSPWRGEGAAPLPERALPAPGKGQGPSASHGAAKLLPGSGSVERRRVVEALLSAVSEKTGYPAEMLELTMGLDGDLGIDSIKRVEILSALQERLPEAPVVKPEHLGRLQTLGQIADFLAQGAAATEKQEPRPEAPAPLESPAPPKNVARYVVHRHKLEPAAPAWSWDEGALVWVTRTQDGLSGALVAELRAHGVQASEIELDQAAPEIPQQLAGLLLVAPLAGEQDSLLRLAFARLRELGPALLRAAEHGPALLATVSRLDGSFGLGPLELPSDVASGGLAGLLKTVHHEWPRLICKAFDLERSVEDLARAARLIVGQSMVEGPLECGIDRAGLWTLGLEMAEIAPGKPLRFQPEDVILVTGGARGVTAEVAVALAHAGAPTLVLLGRSAPPTQEPASLRGAEGEAELKRAILAQAGQRLAPRELEAEYRRVSANREILRNLSRIQEAGARVVYQTLDLRDAEAVAGCVRRITEQLGPISGLLHGAGVLADSTIEKKTDEEFSRVYATKILGLRNLLDVLEDAPLRLMVLFSSSTARFGRRGQLDYAVANEVLNKLAQQQARRRPDCRVVSVNWGPWAGGMVTPALQEMFGREGVEVIELSSGARYLMEELASPGGPVEILILGEGSRLPATTSGGASRVRKPAAVQELKLAFERRLELETHPVLASHVIGGKAVLPVALMVEWLAHAALHGNPGLRFQGLEGLRVFKGATLEPGAAMRLRVGAAKAERRGEQFEVTAELISVDKAGAMTLHSRAKILMGRHALAAAAPGEPMLLARYEPDRAAIYERLLFHGPALQGIDAVDGCGVEGIVARVQAAPAPREWMQGPVRSRWIADPLALDCAFQAMILWSLELRGVPSLPTAIGRYEQYRAAFPAESLRVEIRVTKHEGHRGLADIDWLDERGELIARMRDYECVMDASLFEAFRRNRL